MLVEYLGPEGFVTSTATSGLEGLEQLAGSPVDLVILDVMLPQLSGFEVLRRIRAMSRVPVIMLTARGEEVDRVVGLEMGADDYLPKPFAVRELFARIRSVLRRARMLPPGMEVSESAQLLAFGDWRLDTTARHLLDEEGTLVALSGAEYRLLRVFLDHPQRVLTRDQLLNLTQGRQADAFDRSIDLLVSRVRQRLRDDAREPRYIKTVRSEGYDFSTLVEAAED